VQPQLAAHQQRGQCKQRVGHKARLHSRAALISQQPAHMPGPQSTLCCYITVALPSPWSALSLYFAYNYLSTTANIGEM
jgi:hypothetical protein